MNQCWILLESIMDHDTAIHILSYSSRDPLWHNKDFEGRLGANISDPRVLFVISNALITEKSREIENEIRDLQAVIKPSQEVKRRLVKKIQISLSPSPLEKHIGSICLSQQ